MGKEEFAEHIKSLKERISELENGVKLWEKTIEIDS